MIGFVNFWYSVGFTTSDYSEIIVGKAVAIKYILHSVSSHCPYIVLTVLMLPILTKQAANHILEVQRDHCGAGP